MIIYFSPFLCRKKVMTKKSCPSANHRNISVQIMKAQPDRKYKLSLRVRIDSLLCSVLTCGCDEGLVSVGLVKD